MTVLKIAKWADDGALTDTDTAEFLRDKKLVGVSGLDFTGVASITPAFLDALFRGRAADAPLAMEFVEMTADVAATVERWRRPPPAPKTAAPAGATIPHFASADDPSERHTPSRLMRRLRTQLTRYLEAAYPLNDARLVKSRRVLFETERGGRLLAQDPYIETTPRYTGFSGGFGDLGLPPATADFLTTLASPDEGREGLIFPQLYKHQAEAVSGFLGTDRKNLVVATGTGSGKTECFLLPIVGSLHQEAHDRPAVWAKRGVRALVLYPMNALVNDQLSRMRRLLGDVRFSEAFKRATGAARHPMFGMYTGRTPYAGPRDGSKDSDRVVPLLEYYLGLDPQIAAELRRLGRFPAKDLTAFLAETKARASATKKITRGARKGEAQTEHHWDERLLTGPDDRELLTRHEMIRDARRGQGNAPDVLITNYSMLEYMLMRPFERPLFEQTRAWLAEPGSRFVLVLDEAHMYRGAKGAEVAFLLRRLFDRLGVTDRPDKVSTILTSASLGDRADAIENAGRFAADLTALAPESFSVVTGRRARPERPAPGDAPTADAFAAIDLDRLHAARTGDELRAVLAPLASVDRDPLPPGDESAVLAALHARLSALPCVAQLIDATSKHAVSLDALATAVFPGAKSARRATEVLLTLGSLARTSPDAPGLIPARVHMMFRGIDGLYACIDPSCPGRQVDAEELAPLGRLYVEPRTHCEHCYARVFELASCRECGTAFVLAYAPRGDLAKWDFLWGEQGESLERVQLLPETATATPRAGHAVEQITVQLVTGKILGAGDLTDPSRARGFFVAQGDDGRAHEFGACPVCQPAGSQRKGRIRDHRTRGEQPFTALIETQFAEQPPQNPRPDLPNQGRKVLVFSDGRQKAARLAPALSVSHAQDAFRQVLVLAARALGGTQHAANLLQLYPAVLHVCATRRVDLFPDGAETVWHQDLQAATQTGLSELLQIQHTLQPQESYGRALFDELTERFLSLPQVGVGTIEPDPAIAPILLRDFPTDVLSAEDARTLVRQWIRHLLERRCFISVGVTPGKLGEENQRPRGIAPGKPDDLVPPRFHEHLVRTLEDPAKVRKVVLWFESLRTRNFFAFMNDQYWLKPATLAIRLREADPWWSCARCNRMHASFLAASGPRCDECGGELVDATADPEVLSARAGYYRDAVLRALSGGAIEPFGLTVEEHTAQLTGMEDDDAFNRTERYELRFQDLRIADRDRPGLFEPPIDVLSCTTTMEVGIDIGTLCGVALRNVPPHVANYQQRAGRAGRRGRAIASVVTYAQGGTHDAWYYEDPSRIISGEVLAPVVYVENTTVLRRHAHAWLVQRFFHENVPADPRGYALFEAMGSVEDFLDDARPCSLATMERWLRANDARVLGELARWLPAWSHGAQCAIDRAAVLDGIVPRLLGELRAVLPVAEYAARAGLDEASAAALAMRLGENLLQTLIGRAILPRYAFPTDTVGFWVPAPRKSSGPKWKTEFDYQPQRDLQIALSEYAPGRSLTIDRWRFVSAALYNPYQPDVSRTLSARQPYASCKGCGYVGVGPSAASLAACPVCGQTELFKRPFVRPEGFAPDVNLRREADRGGSMSRAGETMPAKLEVQTIGQWDQTLYGGALRLTAGPRDLVVVNKGLGDRGFMVCAQCGLAEPVWGTGFTDARLSGKRAGQPHPHPTREGAMCTGRALEPYFMGHTFCTDVLLLRLRLSKPMHCRVADKPGRDGAPGRSALTSLVEAISLAASRTLQIDEGELSGNWNPVPDGDPFEADVYLYDLLPGGAGYTHQVRANLTAVLEATRALLAGCTCASSCHRCIRHFGNQMLHGRLDRHLALAVLDGVTAGAVPTVDPARQKQLLGDLQALMRLQGWTCETSAKIGEFEAPMRIVSPSGAITWVDVHHPLTDPDALKSPVIESAMLDLERAVWLDAWTLEHALPSAVSALVGRS